MASDRSTTTDRGHKKTDKIPLDRSQPSDNLAIEILGDTLDEAGLDTETAEAEIGYSDGFVMVSVSPSEYFSSYLEAVEEDDFLEGPLLENTDKSSTDPAEYTAQKRYAIENIDDLDGEMDARQRYMAVVDAFRTELWDPDERLEYEEWDT